MRVLMLVWTGVATDTRVLREARSLVDLGHSVHIIGRAVPADFVPPVGVTVGSVGLPPLAEGRQRNLRPHERLVRWALLPQHVARRLHGWQAQALALARSWAADVGRPDVVHAHDYTALSPAERLSAAWSVPLVYDTHEYWVGRPVEGRPAPLLRRHEGREEARLAARAAAVITVGQGVAETLRSDHPDWPAIEVVRNTFPTRTLGPVASPPTSFVYAGRLARDRELEVVAAASRSIALPVILMGPGDAEWVDRFDPGRAEVRPAGSLADVDALLVASGAALVTHSDRWANHRLAMPNKLFHAVSLGVPVVATDVGELGALVRTHRLGTLYRPGDAEGLARAAAELVARHAEFVANTARARQALSWEADAAALAAVYERIGGPPDVH